MTRRATADIRAEQVPMMDRTSGSGVRSAREAAAELGLNERTIRRAIAGGELHAAKEAGMWRISAADLASYRQSHPRAIRFQPRIRRPTVVPLPIPTPLPALPRPLARLIGRERELAEIGARLRDEGVRLLTLTGPGGVGKTRLALEAAAMLEEAHADGVAFIPLATVPDPNLVLPTLARSLNVQDRGSAPLPQRLQGALRRRRLLLVLDNVEHLLPAAPEVAELLAACPRLAALVTSRAPLRVSGEQIYPVGPLSLPDAGQDPSLAELAESAAVTMFVERARAFDPHMELTETNGPVVADICRRLDGLPLGIELAAAQTRILPLSAVRDRIADRLPLVCDGPRDQPDRLRTMRNAIDWSYDLLSPAEQALFRRLAVFAGGFTLDAAERVGGEADRREGGEETDDQSVPPIRLAASPPDVLDLLVSLVDQSLLRREGLGDGGVRFGMLETIREFGLGQLAAAGEEDSIRRRHAAWCLALAERGESTLSDRAEEAWVGRLGAELGNLRAALAWTIGRRAAASALRLAAALGPLWLARGPYREGRGWLEQALALGDGPANARVAALVFLARLVFLQGDLVQAATLGEEALALARTIGDRPGTARALLAIGEAADRQGDLDRSASCHEEALELFRALGDTGGIAETQGHLAIAAWLRGDVDRYAALAEAALALWRNLGDRRGMIQSLDMLSLAARLRGDLGRQAALVREVVALSGEIGDPYVLASTLWTVASIAGERGRAALSARFFGAEEALREATGFVLDPAYADAYVTMVGEVRAALGEAAFAKSWTAGRALAPAEAVAEAMAAMDNLAVQPGGIPATAGSAAYRLTRREIEVLRLLANGLSDQEISATLFIARKTASKHVSAILAKLGLPSRSAAALYAVRHGLV